MIGRSGPWILLAALASILPAEAGEPALKVCLDEDLPPLSVHRRGKPDSGFEVELARLIADRLDRELQIQWFESKLDEDSSPALEANALLSDGRCALVGSYAFTTDSLALPGVKTAKLPDFEGATREDRRRRVAIGALAPTQPYIYSALTVVLGPDAWGRAIHGLADLAGLRLAIESGTVGDAILMNFGGGRLIDSITHLVPGRDDLLGRLERGDFDATLLDPRRFDAHRLAHADSRLSASGYYYPIGVNRGYVALASDQALVSAVNAGLGELQREGRIEQLARSAGLTYLPPREPTVLGDVWQQIIQK